VKRFLRFLVLLMVICAGLALIDPALVAGFLLFPVSLFVLLVLLFIFKRPFP
jgi:hypothetical protein